MEGAVRGFTLSIILAAVLASSARAETLNLGLVATANEPYLLAARADRRLADDESIDPHTGEPVQEGLDSKQHTLVKVIAIGLGAILVLGLAKKFYDEGIDLQRA